jgi:glycosyltransferase involved in cell wall biosynthesis
MTPVSLVCSYYDDPRRLFDLVWNPTTFEYFDEIIIVDDGSQKHLARDVLVDLIVDEPSLSDRVRLFRIPWDYGFNNHGARNLAMRFVHNEWCTLIDIDNVMDHKFCNQLQKMIASAPEDTFIIHNADITPNKDTLNHFTLKHSQFWRCGGYDEEFMGIHYGDKVFRHRLDSHYEGIWMPVSTPIRFTRGMHIYQYSEDCKITTYVDDKIVQHPPERYRIAIEQYCWERNEDQGNIDNNYRNISEKHGKYFYYEDDLECRQLELDLGIPNKTIPSRRVPYHDNPFYSSVCGMVEQAKRRGMLT